MNPKVSIGIQNFEKLRKYRAFYADKTNFIREWWENPDEVTLITRPRRFGKTLNLSMMECFFSTEFAGRGDLFEDLSVWKHEKYRQLQGTYPVIFVSFAGVKGSGVWQKGSGMTDLHLGGEAISSIHGQSLNFRILANMVLIGRIPVQTAWCQN